MFLNSSYPSLLVLNIGLSFWMQIKFAVYYFTVVKIETGSDFVCGHIIRKWLLDPDTVTLRSSLYKFQYQNGHSSDPLWTLFWKPSIARFLENISY